MTTRRELTTRERLARLHRRLLVRAARDLTQEVGGRRALVLAPHPDDETIGCGATIRRKTAAGTAVLVVVAADGHSPVRRAECIEACRRLGVDGNDVRFLGFPDGGLREHRDELVTQVAAVVREFQPAELYVPSAIDQHPDHRALAESVHALTGSALEGIDVLAYPIWFWNRWAWVERGPTARQLGQFAVRFSRHLVTVRPRIVRTGEFIVAKQDALAAHVSQTERGGREDASSDPLDERWLELFLGPEELFFAL